MRYDEIETVEQLYQYAWQMFEIYSMPRNTPHWEEYWASVCKSMEEKRAQIARPRRMRLDPREGNDPDLDAAQSLYAPRGRGGDTRYD